MRVLGGKCQPTIHADLTLMFEIAPVGYDDDRAEVPALDVKNLLVQCTDPLERVARCDGVDKEKPFALAHSLFAQGPVRGNH